MPSRHTRLPELLDNHRAQNRRTLVGALARAEAHRANRIAVGQRELGLQSGDQRRAGRGNELTLNRVRCQRQAMGDADIQRCGNGHGNDAVLAANRPVTIGECGNDHAADVQSIN